MAKKLTKKCNLEYTVPMGKYFTGTISAASARTRLGAKKFEQLRDTACRVGVSSKRPKRGKTVTATKKR